MKSERKMDNELEQHELCQIFPLMPDDQFNALVADIEQNGQQQPIVLYKDKILDGRNRYKACLQLGRQPVTVIYEGNDPLGFVISLNLNRRHLTESQRGMIAAQLATLKRGANRFTLDRPIGPSRITQSDAASKLNVGQMTLKRAKKVLDKGSPDLVAAVKAGDITASVAAKIADLDPEQQQQVIADPRPDQAIKKVMRAEREQELADRTIQQSLAVADKLYGVIYADPPWRFETHSENGMDRSADNHYPTMSWGDLYLLRPPAADDCVLFLWATAPMIRQALAVMDVWGFQYMSQIIWVKDRTGTGYWTRNKHEHLLIGTKGNVPAPAMGHQPQSVFERPVGRHSEKPECFADMITAIFPTTPKLEMFGRNGRVGWDVMGNEAPDPV